MPTSDLFSPRRLFSVGAALALLTLPFPASAATPDNWTGTAGDHNFNNPLNWSVGVPTSANDATNPLAQTITHSQNVTDTVSSFKSTNTGSLLSVTGGYLDILNAFTLSGASAAITNGAVLELSGTQTISSGTLTLGDSASAGFLDIDGGKTITLASTLTVNGPQAVIGDQSAGSGTSSLVNQTNLTAGAGGNWFVSPTGTLTNSATGTLAATGANAAITIGDGSDMLNNLGTISAASGGAVFLNAGTYTHLGTATASGTGSFVILQGGTVSDYAGLHASNGGSVSLNTTLSIGTGTFNPATVAGTPGGSGSGFFLVNNGAITGDATATGTIANSQTLAFAESSTDTLTNVTLSGTGLTLTGSNVQIAGKFNYAQGTGFASDVTFDLSPSGNGVPSSLTFGNANINGNGSTLLDNAVIQFGGGPYAERGTLAAGNGTTLILGGGLVIDGTNAVITGDATNVGSATGFGYGSVTSDAVLYSSSGGTFAIDDTTIGGTYHSTFTNNSLVEADNTSGNATHSEASIAADTLVNNGTIKALNGGFVPIAAANYTKLGAIVADGGSAEVSLGGTGTIHYGAGDSLTTADTANTGASGFIQLATVLDLGNGTLNVDSIGAADTLALFGGTIQNGTIQNAQDLSFNGTSLSFFPATLSNVTLSTTNGTDPTVLNAYRGGVILAGNIHYASGAKFQMPIGGIELNNAFINGNATANVLDNATVQGNISGTPTVAAAIGQNLTLGSALTVDPGVVNGSVTGIFFTADHLTSNTTLFADTSKLISLTSVVPLGGATPTTFINNSTVHAGNSGNAVNYPGSVSIMFDSVTNNGTLQGDDNFNGGYDRSAFVTITTSQFVNNGTIIGNVKVNPVTGHTLAVTNGGTIDVPIGQTPTLPGYTQIGTAAVTQVDGTLTLTGPLLVNGGTLKGTGTIIGSVVIGGGTTAATQGTINLVDGATHTLTFQNTAGSAALTLGGATAGSYSNINLEIGPASASDTVAVTNNALLTVNTGGAKINLTGLSGFGAGTYNLLTFGTGDATGLANLSLGTKPNAGGAYAYALSPAATSEQLLVTQAATPTTAYWRGDQSSTWTTITNGFTNFYADQAGTTNTALPGATTDVVFNTNNVNTANLNTTLGGNISIKGLTFASNATTPVTVGGNSTLTLGSDGMTVQSGAAAETVSTSVALGAAQTWTNNSSNTLTVSGLVKGSGALTTGGTGKIVLTGPNTYAGGTTVSSGTVSGGTANFGTGTVTVSSGATADYTQNAATSYAASITGSGSVTVGGNASSPNGTGGTITYTGADNASGGTTVSSGTLTLSHAGGGALTGPVAIATGGTVGLGAASEIQLASTATTTLSGGTLAANGKNDGTPTASALGKLQLTGPNTSTLDFGDASGLSPTTLSFADSSTLTWTGTLLVTNYTSGHDALYIGTSKDLSTAQLSDIKFGGIGASQLSTGQVVFAPEPGGLLPLLIGGGALAVRITARRRRRAY